MCEMDHARVGRDLDGRWADFDFVDGAHYLALVQATPERRLGLLRTQLVTRAYREGLVRPACGDPSARAAARGIGMVGWQSAKRTALACQA